MGIVLLLITLIMVGLLCIKEYRRAFLSPAFIFYAYQIIMLIGLMIKMDFSYTADYVLCSCYFLGNLFFAVGNSLSFKVGDRGSRSPSFMRARTQENANKISKRMLFIAIVGIIICALFFARNGNVFVESLRLAFSGNESNLSNMRRTITLAGGSGYIYELRVYVIPCAVFYLLLYAKGKYRQYAIILLLPTLLFLVASGQRAGLVYAILMVLISLMTVNHYLMKRKILRDRRIKLLLAFGAGAFGLLTVFNGRTRNAKLLYAVYKRIFLDNQACDITSFRYIIFGNKPCLGYDWLQMFLRFIPGIGDSEYRSLSGRTFAYLFGWFGGTSPPSLWGSMYYNWGIVGIVFFAFLFGIFCRALYLRMFKRELTPYRLHMFAYMFYAAGSWICESPVHFLNAGFVVLLIVHLFMRTVLRSNRYEGINPISVR